MERKPLQTAIYQDVIDEFQAKEGDSYQEIKYQIRAEYERRCTNYRPGYAMYEGEAGIEEKKRFDEFKKRYQSRGKLPKTIKI